MSVKVMGLVFDADLPRDEKYVLLSYADHAAHDGTDVYPSVGRMAWKTGYARRSIQIITAKLVKKGILVEDGRGWHGTNRYRIDLDALPQRKPYEGGVQNLQGCRKQQGGVQKTARGGADSAPNPSCNRHEPSHVADDARVSVGGDLATQEWIEELENQTPPPRNPPRSAEEMREQLLETEQRMLARQAQEPCLTWGVESEEMQRQVQRFGDEAYTVLRLGYELDRALGLRPIWNDRKKVKTWTSGLSACLAEADGDWKMVVEAARVMRENKLSIKNPYSIEGMVADAAAKGRGSQQPSHIEVKA